MTTSDLRRAMALCRAAGNRTVPVPIHVLARLLRRNAPQSSKLPPPAAGNEVAATHGAGNVGGRQRRPQEAM